MNPLTYPAITAERQNYPGCDWFFDLLEEFLHHLQEWQVDINPQVNGQPIGDNHPAGVTLQKNGLPGGICTLRFYFFFRHGGENKNGGYKNGIWIQVKSIHELDIWLRVGFSRIGNMNVNIWSRCPLDCPGIYMAVHPTLALPPNFNVRGIFKTEGIVHDTTINEILNEICNIMPCVCNSNCL
jgi:hypothetical protein